MITWSLWRHCTQGQHLFLSPSASNYWRKREPSVCTGISQAAWRLIRTFFYDKGDIFIARIFYFTFLLMGENYW